MAEQIRNLMPAPGKKNIISFAFSVILERK